MSRKIAFIFAGLLTSVVAAFLFMMTFSSKAALAEDSVEIAVPTAETKRNTQQSSHEFELALAAREAALTEQLSQRQTAVAALDDAYEGQFVTLEAQLEETNTLLAAATMQIEELRMQAESAQAGIVAADQAFQEEMDGLQGSWSYQDTTMRQEIEAIYFQLQQVYDQIAAQEAQAMGSAGGNGASVSSSNNDHNDHEGDEHEEHDGDEHEDHEGDEHEDHDD